MGRAVVSAPMALGMGCALILCWSLQAGWGATFGPLFNWLANLGITIPLKGLPDVGIHPFGFLHTIDRNIRAWLTQGIALSERSFVRFLNATVEPFLLMAGVALALGLALFELAQYVRHSLPHTITERVVAPTKAAIDKRARETAQALGLRLNSLTHRFDLLRARVDHLAHATAGTIASPFPRIGRIEREAHDATNWLKRHRYLAAYTSLAALGLAMLKRLGLGWLRCRNVNKAGKAVCGMNPLALEALLLTALPLAVDFDLEAFAEEMQTVTEEAASLIHKFAT